MIQKIRITNNGSYALMLAILYAISPILSLCIALMMYKNWVSQTFFILFAFYFGFQLGPNLDLMQHYHNYLDFFGKSFFDRYSDFATLYLGKEPFHIVFKYILSRVELSSRVFCGCAAAIYATTFIYFIRQFKDFYTQKMGWLRTLVLLTLAVTVEFYWYFGLRFWTGGFVFMIFYCKYIITTQKKYLFLTLSALLFHFALFAVIAVAILAEFLKNYKLLLYIIVGISTLYREVEWNLINFLSSFSIFRTLFKSSYQSSSVQRAIANRAKEYYEKGNIVYQSRIPLLMIFFFSIIILLWTKNKNVTKSYPKMYACILILLAIANFGHADFVFYERYLKFCCLLSYSYLFLILFDKANDWINHTIFTKLVLAGIFLIAFCIPLYQQRQLISEMALWFGNFFTLIPLKELGNT